MQLILSSLVDLALGKPHYLECDNLNFLHTLLHVILKKTKLSATRVELTDDLADKAEKMMKLIPAEPSICFRDYELKADGGRIRKRSSREIGVKRSFTLVKKKWPLCCPVPSNSKVTIKAESSSSGSSTKSAVGSSKENQSSLINAEIKSVKVSTDYEELASKFESLFKELSQRIESTESKLVCFTEKIEEQNTKNCAVYEEFQSFKSDFAKSASFLGKLKASETEKSSRNCEIKLNIRQKSPVASDSDDDEDELPANNEVISEIAWLKARMLELSESLKLHSQCLKTLKCDDFDKMKRKFENLQDSLMSLKFQVMMNQGNNCTTVCENNVEDVEEIVRVREEVFKLNCHLKETDKQLEKVKEEACEGLYSLKQDLLSRINNQLRSRTATTNHSSHFIRTENLEKLDESEDNQSSMKCCGSLKNDQQSEASGENKNLTFNWYQPPSPKIISLTSSCRQFHFPSNSAESMQGNPEEPSCFECPRDCPPPCSENLQCSVSQEYQNGYMHRDCLQPCSQNLQCSVSQEYQNGYMARDCLQPCSQNLQCSVSQEYQNGYMPNKCQYLSNDNKNPQQQSCNNQVEANPQGLCVQQLVRVIDSKMDRKEFECYRRQLCQMSDVVMCIKQRLECTTSAGGVVPVSCISCQGSTNMNVTSNSFPFVPALKFGRMSESCCSSCDIPPECPNLLNRYCQRQIRKGPRRACGSHTKLAKAIEIREMRFKRLRTPIKVVTPMMVFKNYCRRPQIQC